MTVAHNVSLARLPGVARNGFIDGPLEREQAQRYVDRLRIKTPTVAAEVASLSGGNQQKVALARWLAIEPKVLIVDEPTQGVDVGSKSEIHALLQDVAARGVAVLMISSDLPEILGMSDRIAVMRSVPSPESCPAMTPHRSVCSPWRSDTDMRETHRREAWVGLAIAAMAAALAIGRPEYFSRGNLLDLFLASLAVLIIAAGMTVVSCDGDRHLIGSAFALCAVRGRGSAKRGYRRAVARRCVGGALIGA